MAEGWTLAEVEATVADYFEMLDHELRGVEYNKSAHRHHLAELLNHRSDGAIERKHQNISAVLIELGFAYISGYKPLGNYQHLLFDVVAERLDASPKVVDLVSRQVAEPAIVPGVEDILAAMVDPPTPGLLAGRSDTNRQLQRAPLRVDYLALESRNRSLGAAGEEFVVRFEVARLARAGRDRLATKVERVSKTRGDGLGFDILSFDDSGKDRLIEVKTTAYGSSTPFFVTRNEVVVSREEGDRYHLYRPFDFRRQPKLFAKRGPLDASFCLAPSQFLATIG